MEYSAALFWSNQEERKERKKERRKEKKRTQPFASEFNIEVVTYN